MSDSMTSPSAQWTTDRSVVSPIRPVTLYQDTNGDWVATTVPSDAIGRITGMFVELDGIWSGIFGPRYGSGALTALKSSQTPSSLLAYP